MKTGIERIAILFLLLSICFVARSANAYTISSVQVNGENDFVLEPGKAEFHLNPGESTEKMIYVTNRTDRSVTFKVQVEDFVGSSDPLNPVVLLEGDKSPYSFKDYLKPEITEFTLRSGQRISLPVKINVPQNKAPGGYYSSVLISNQPTVEESVANDTVSGRTKTISRLGVLFFVRVNGLADEQGSVEDFRLKGARKLFHQGGPFTFEVLFNNKGSVHLVPYGTIEIKNTLGKVIQTIPVDAYFSLPHSIRYRDMKWDPGFLLGRYTAHLTLHRGYGQTIDERTISILILPWKYIALFVGIVFIIMSAAYYIKRNFEFRRKI